ncbi:hypothetical protein CRG98_008207 [Punica granatum]|uniref:Uncharacterized protein n=1 Tax=Punica granatum TaxID=22663 RepID=A0A2I0KSE0_PUNGR|nr:hypothetical protein CRG98_008207 [Punica granatum]
MAQRIGGQVRPNRRRARRWKTRLHIIRESTSNETRRSCLTRGWPRDTRPPSLEDGREALEPEPAEEAAHGEDQQRIEKETENKELRVGGRGSGVADCHRFCGEKELSALEELSRAQAAMKNEGDNNSLFVNSTVEETKKKKPKKRRKGRGGEVGDVGVSLYAVTFDQI